jgi:FkbM family methyltransferase
MKDYSQNGEQGFVLGYFTQHPVKGGPRFLDIGAHDGMTLSNTWGLVQNGCGGEYVEADPDLVEILKQRANPISRIHCAAFAKRGSAWTIPFYRSRGGGDFYGTTSEAQTRKFSGLTKFDKIEVPTITIDSLPGPYDFISLDVEGQNWELLPELEPRLNDCQLICVEHDNHDREMLEYLEKFGLKRLLTSNAENILVGR